MAIEVIGHTAHTDYITTLYQLAYQESTWLSRGFQGFLRPYVGKTRVPPIRTTKLYVVLLYFTTLSPTNTHNNTPFTRRFYIPFTEL